MEFNLSLPIALGSDHAGYVHKEALKKKLELLGLKVEDFGTHSEDSADYPDYAHPVSKMVENEKGRAGILICGSGNGVCMVANKHAGIRAALCWNEELASLARQHNNANIVCLPARFINLAQAEQIVKVFLNTKFEGGRHERRAKKI